MVFCVLLQHGEHMVFRFTQVVRMNQHFFYFCCQIAPRHRHRENVYLPVISWWTLGSFNLLAVMKNTTTSLHIQVFMYANVFIRLGQTSRSGIAGSYCKFLLNLKNKNNYCFSPMAATPSHSYQPYTGVPVAVTGHQQPCALSIAF